MGWDITFRSGDKTQEIRVHFAGMARSRQERRHGLSFADCISYGPDGDDELWGAINGEGGGWWRPRTQRGIERCKSLIGKVRDEPSHPMDEERLLKLLSGLEMLKDERKGMVTMSF